MRLSALGLLSIGAAVLLHGQGGFRRLESTPAPSGSLVKRVVTLTDRGGRVDWSHSRNLIAFDRVNSQDFFEIWVVNPDGSGERCLTCNKSALPGKHKGNPEWHPNGQFIAFQAQTNFRGIGKLTNYFGNPGAGANNDLWLMDSEGNRFWQITHLPPRSGAVLHPHFSRQGDQIFWSERYEARGGENGLWTMKVGQFSVVNGEPRVSNIREYRPGRQKYFYESHSFGIGGKGVLFSGNCEPGQKITGLDIYGMSLETGQSKNLTNTLNEWDEHAHVSPNGRTIVWMSSRGIPGPIVPAKLQTDLWLMNFDGSNQRRLTYFNEAGHPESLSGHTSAADSAWSPDGRKIAVYLITEVGKHQGRVAIIELNDSY